MVEMEIERRLAGLSPAKRKALLKYLKERSHATAVPRPAEEPPGRSEGQRPDPADLARLPEGVRGVEDVYPLSPLQQGMLFHSLYRPGVGEYVQQLSFTFTGPLDPAAVRRAVEEVVRRHPPLRTAFFWNGLDEPLQAVLREVALPWEEEDWRGLPETQVEERLARRLRDDARGGFELGQAPLLRLRLIRTGDQHHRFVWCFHHLLLDGWSFLRVLRETLSLYLGFLEGREAAAEPLRPFGDFISWLRGQDGAASEAYWRRTLAGFTTPSLLGAERKTAEEPAGPEAYSSCRRRLAAPRSAVLRAFATRNRLSLNVLFQGAWSLLLARSTGSRDVLFGLTTSGRSAGPSWIDSMIGMFMNTLPLRVRVPLEASLVPWLHRLQANQAELLEHEHSPLEEVQRLSDVPPGQPLFDNILVSGDFPVDASLSSAGDLALSDFRYEERTNYPLTVDVMEQEVRITYDRRLFERSAAERLLGHFTRLLAALEPGPERRLGEIPWLSAAELQQTLVEWNDTAAAPLPESAGGFLDGFAAQAGRTPEAVAAVCEDAAMSYRELAERSGLLAARLAAEGVAADALVALLAPRGLDFLTAVLAVWKAGGAYLPLDPHHPPERHRTVLERSGTGLVLVADVLAEALAAATAGWSAPRVLTLETALAGTPSVRTWPTPPPAGLAYVIYTSGSTGVPKGAMVEHRGMANHLAAKIRDLGLGAGDRVAQNASQCFDISVWQFLAPLLLGARVVIYGDEVTRDPERLLARAREDRITVLEVVPSVMRLMLPESHEEVSPLPDLRWMIPTGEALPPELARRWHGAFEPIPLVNAYGPTECSDDVSHHTLREPLDPAATTVPIGRPVRNLRLHVLCPDLRPSPIGVAGELGVAGTGVGRGYLRDPRRTAETFVPDPFGDGGRLYRTGDLARFTSTGVLEFLGRVDHQVKLRGLRIELGEIEAVLDRHPAVEQAVVVVHEEKASLLAWLVAADGHRAEPEALKDFLRESLPEYMVPASFGFLDALPVSANGKVDRKALARREPPESRAATRSAPLTPAEELMAGIWSEVLGVERVGREQSFFELGGHSLLATRVVSRARQVFGVELPLRTVFDTPRLADLARHVDRAPRRALPPLRPREAGRDVQPLSFAQERLWLIDQMMPAGETGAAAYAIPVAVRLRGPLEVAALAAALAEIVRRHESLRTTFEEAGGRPVQVVGPYRGFALPEVDLSALVPERGRTEARRLALSDALRPFDLKRGPLMRAVLLRLGAEEHLALFNMHHVVSDGWSMPLLLRELTALYPAATGGRPSPLPELPVQYADFALWQRRWLAGETLAQEVAWWRRQLEGAAQVLEPPTDRPRPAVQSFRGASVRVALDPGLVERLEALCRQRGSTLFMALLSAFEGLLSNYSGQRDFLLGTPIANRNQAEVEGLIGFFVNTLVLRSDLDGRPSFGELLARVRERSLAVYAHQDLPFEKLVDELRPERDLSRAPLFQVMFAFQHVAPAPALPGVGLSFLAVEAQTSKFDLTLFLNETADGVTGFVEYASDLFDATTVRRLWSGYESLLDAAVTSPDAPLPALPLPGTAERHQLLREWNGTARAPRPETSVTRLLEAQARRTPEAVAVIFGDRVLTYRELDGLAARLGRRLRRLGVGPETLVGVCSRPCPELLVALLGIWKAGAAYVPLDPEAPKRRLLTLLEDSGASWLLAERRLAEHLPDPYGGERTLWLEDEVYRETEDGADPAVEVAPDNLAYVLYTSGSTGRPKGVEISHRALVNLLYAMVEEVAPTPEDVFVALASLSFDISTVELYLPWLLGARTVLVDREVRVDGAALARLLDESGATVVQATPAGWKMLVGASWPGGPGLKVITGGEALSGDLACRLLERSAAAWNLYGPTEATVYAAGVRLAPGAAVTIGHPVANTWVLLTTDDGEPVPLGAHGELQIGGQGLARGYRGRPGLTAERFLPDPFSGEPGARAYRSGDLARRLPDGRIDYLGRVDHQLKIRGYRIEPAEVEAALLRHPAVREAVVLARGEPPGEPRLVAYLVAANPAPGVSDLRQAAAETLPLYMVPSSFVFLDALPLTPSGKVDRRSLPDPTSERPVLSAEYAAPRTTTETLVAELWREALQIDRVGRSDSFFDLGGHSLLLAQVRAGLQERLGREVPILEMFRYPTLAALAQYLDAEAPEKDLAAEEEQDERRKAGMERLRHRRQRALAEERA